MDEPDDEEMANQEAVADVDVYKCNRPGRYSLQSFITHLGASVHAGHYVCHVHKQVEENAAEKGWIYYNDAKVAKTDDPPIGKGYLYFFTKV